MRNLERKPACSLRGQLLRDARRLEERRADEVRGETEEVRAAALSVRALIWAKGADGSIEDKERVEDEGTPWGANVPGRECPRRWVACASVSVV